MLRLILVALFLVIHAIFGIILLPVTWIIGKFSQNAKDRFSMGVIKVTFRIILVLSGVSTTAIGLENIPSDEPVLFIGNHNGFYDIIISYVYLKQPTGFVAKKEMLKVYYIRRWMYNIRCLFLDRENMKEGLKTILQGIDYIKNGVSIFIFPEGTRNKTGAGVQDFHAGSFKFAEKTNCKIIPVTQNNTANVFENHFPWIKRTHTVIEFGTPIDITTFDKEERKKIAPYTQHIIEEMYEKNQSLV